MDMRIILFGILKQKHIISSEDRNEVVNIQNMFHNHVMSLNTTSNEVNQKIINDEILLKLGYAIKRERYKHGENLKLNTNKDPTFYKVHFYTAICDIENLIELLKSGGEKNQVNRENYLTSVYDSLELFCFCLKKDYHFLHLLLASEEYYIRPSIFFQLEIAKELFQVQIGYLKLINIFSELMKIIEIGLTCEGSEYSIIKTMATLKLQINQKFSEGSNLKHFPNFNKIIDLIKSGVDDIIESDLEIVTNFE